MRELTEPRLQDIFRAVLDLGSGVDVTRLERSAEPAWDSLAHALLVAAVESEFGLQVDAGDSLELTSYDAMVRYLESRGL